MTDIYVLGKFVDGPAAGGAPGLSSRGPSPLAESTTAVNISQAPQGSDGSSLQVETVSMSAISRPREAPVGDFFRYATRGPRAGQWEAISMDTEVSCDRARAC